MKKINVDRKVFVICLIMAIIAFLSLISCKTQAPIVQEREVLVTKYEKVYLRDTIVKLRIDSVFLQNNSKDTISKLKTPLASSTAMWSNGRLFHSLSQGGTINPTIQIKEVVKTDTIIKNNTSTRIEYKDKEIPTFLIFLMWSGGIFWCLFFIFIIGLILWYKLKK